MPILPKPVHAHIPTRMADLPSPEALSISTLTPIEQRWPAAVVRGFRFQAGDYPGLDPGLADLLLTAEPAFNTMKDMYANVARMLAEGTEAVTVNIGGQPAWRFWRDGRVEDLH